MQASTGIHGRHVRATPCTQTYRASGMLCVRHTTTHVRYFGTVCKHAFGQSKHAGVPCGSATAHVPRCILVVYFAQHRASTVQAAVHRALRWQLDKTHLNAHAHVRVCVCACALARVCACVWVWVSVCVRMRVGVGGCACVCGCTRVSACGCVCVWKCVRARAVWQLGKHASWDHTGECCGLVKGAQHARCCMLQGRAALFMVRSGEQGCTVCDAQWYAKLHFLQYAVVCKAALLVMRRDASWAAARARHASHRASATPTLDSAGLFTAGCAS